MAQRTQRLSMAAFAYVRQDYPSTHYMPSGTSWYSSEPASGKTGIFFMQIPDLPSALKHRKLISGTCTLALKGSGRLYVAPYSGIDQTAFNSVTYNTRYTLVGNYGEISNLDASSGQDVSASYEYESWIAMVLKNKVLGVHPASNSVVSSRATLMNGSTVPYLDVVYNDSEYYECVTSMVSPAYDGGTSVNPGVAKTFEWTLMNASDPTPWVQKSAIFYWRATEGSSATTAWHSVSISGNTRTVTIPAKTFPAGRTIQYYIKIVDELDNTLYEGSTSSPHYFTTQNVKPGLTAPANNATLNPAAANTFSWTLASEGGTTYSQKWGQIRWTDDPNNNDKSTWNTIDAGTSKSKSVPAYTFPPNSTIRWTVAAEGVSLNEDGTGWYSDTVRTFTTENYVLAVTQAPSGSGISTIAQQTFAYTLKTTGGTNVTQSSAILYWRPGTSGTYNAISNSTGTKNFVVPANTFPTGKTIQWYLSVTAADSTVYTTSAATFTTVTPSVTETVYPSGSNICSGDPLTFQWDITSTAGSHPQQSATFYWRQSTLENYQSIAVSGSTKQVTVPAQTFGTGKTVYWYISATDVGGTTSQTSAKSFNTATSKITQQGGPTSGYKDPRTATTFACYFAAGSGSVTGTGKLYWKESIAGSYTEVAMTNNSVTIAANTFPVASTIQWYLAGTDYDGNSSQTEVYSFSTAASTAYARCIAPIGRVEDGTKPISFKWDVVNDDGTAPARILVQWKQGTDIAWTTLLDTTDAVYAYTAAAGTFTAGPVTWKATAWNRDSVQGPENEASFICLMAPDAPAGLAATPVPRTTISWQGEGQEAYEISIDGIVVAKEYGQSVYSWQAEEPLEDGVHTISVRIQGTYGLWSNESTTTIDVENVPATTITLTGEFGIDALLAWEYGDTVSDPKPNVYRDGVRIAALSDKLEFTDRFVLGEHDYYVTLWDSDGYYTKSNTVTGLMESAVPRICSAEGGEWLTLRLTDASDEVQDFQWSMNYALHSIRGAGYPILETGTHETLTGSYSCAFQTAAEARQLEALRGKIVIMKSRKENVVIGGLMQIRKQVRQFYISCTFSLQQLHWEDFIRDENR